MSELHKWLADYSAAFAARSPARVAEFYARGTIIRFHRDGARTIRAYRGIGAVLRLAMPLAAMFSILFRQLAKRDYDHSDITIVGARDGFVHVRFDRMANDGSRIEWGSSIYRFENGKIAECWLWDNREPPESAVEGYRAV